MRNASIPIVVLAFVVAALALGQLFPWLKTPFILALCYGLAALGVTVLLRAGQTSFGHAMYALIAGYTVAFVGRAYPHLDGLFLLVAGVGVSVIAAMVIGLFVVRYRGIFFAMLNLAISMVLFSLVGKLYETTGGSDGFRIQRATLAGVTFDRSGYEAALLALTLVAAVVLGWLVQRYFRSAAGEAMAGIKTNETRLEYLGLSTQKMLWNGYLVSAGLVGVSGALLALLQGLVTPELGYWMVSAEFVFIAVLGGTGHALGAFVGALVYECGKMIGGIFLADVWRMMLGVILLAVIFLVPAGISGLFRTGLFRNGLRRVVEEK
jgi:ABC-type branched-subunit amino acid transport system permease subunit